MASSILNGDFQVIAEVVESSDQEIEPSNHGLSFEGGEPRKRVRITGAFELEPAEPVHNVQPYEPSEGVNAAQQDLGEDQVVPVEVIMMNDGHAVIDPVEGHLAFQEAVGFDFGGDEDAARDEDLRIHGHEIIEREPVPGLADELIMRFRDLQEDILILELEDLLVNIINDVQVQVMNGLSDEMINELLGRRIFVSPFHDINIRCTVCQEDYSEGEELGELDCLHTFHPPCITPWLRLENKCPNCLGVALS